MSRFVFRDPIPAARARLPLECERVLAPGEPTLHWVKLGLTRALEQLCASVSAPLHVVATAAWVALAARLGAVDAEIVVKVRGPSSNGSSDSTTVAVVPAHEQPFVDLVRAVQAQLDEPSTDRADAPFIVDARPGSSEEDSAELGTGIASLAIGDASSPVLFVDASRFLEEAAQRVALCLTVFVAFVSERPSTPIGDVDILPEDDREKILEVFNATRETIAPTCFHYLFEDQAHETPDRPALAFKGEVLTYRVLNERANRIASFLRRHGGGGGTCIALHLERSAEMIVALLGILKAGSAYVPLLPDAPRARLAHQLAETAAPIILTQKKLADVIPQSSGLRIVCLDAEWEEIAREPADDPPRTSSPEDLAYVIYTSGSTGNPKGVAVMHDNLVNYTHFLSKKLGVPLGSKPKAMSFATVSTLAADLGNTSIFPCLATGGCLHVIDHDTGLDGVAFAAYARQNPIDVLKITPSHLGALMAFECGDDALPRKFLVTGGEASTWPLLERTKAKRGLVWFNHYGPTETTIGSLTCDIDETARAWSPTIPIGRPIANTKAYVLDERRRLVPIGVVGELYIGGRGVTRGYMNQPDLTSERFLKDPFVTDESARMYRTGDRVRQLPDGAIEFLGRVDHQVKIRGFRIELGEIEAALRQLPEVRQTIVVAREDRTADVRVVAYIVPNGAPPSVSALRSALSATLPSFMLPSAFVMLDALPLTPNGKVDRRALPAPQEDGPAEGPSPSPLDPLPDDVEAHVMKIWKDVLGIRRLAPQDDFFRVGGDSLKALYVVARIEKDLGKRLSHGDFIMNPTVAGNAAALRNKAPSRDFASLIPLQPFGSKPPLFCIHGGGGHVYYYRDLAKRLGSDQPFYGLQGRHADGKMPRQTRVEDMAEFYLEEIKHVAPEGPYFLCGASFGGKVAFEMAQILHRRGETAALVAMFDTWGPGYPNYRVGPALRGAGWLYRRIEHHLGSVLMLEPELRAAYLKDKAAKTKQELQDFLNLKLSRMKNVPGMKEVGPDVDEGFIAIASRAYKPVFYPGKVTLFRSKNQPLGIDEDPNLGWGGLSAELEIHDVIGLHAAVVAEPRVRYLVEKFKPCLEAAQAEFAPASIRSPRSRAPRAAP